MGSPGADARESGRSVGEPALDRLAAIARELDADHVLTGIETLRQRVAAGRFYVACVGQFKRGKSTLINALVGRPVLPVGIVPVTSVPTIVQYGEAAAVLVRFLRGESLRATLAELEAYVAESRNPQNTLGVEAVEVFLPSVLLGDGLCLVDTPGLGSIFERNSATTRAFVPQIDAVLAVTGADPPLSGDELALIQAAAQHAQHVIVVLNKADRCTDTERDEARRFAAEALSRGLGRPVGELLVVSATERLAGDGPTRDWDRLRERLRDLARGSRGALVRGALTRGIARLTAQCTRALEETRAALWRPIEESERRMERLRGFEGDVADRWLRLGFAMDHEGDRLLRAARSRGRQFIEESTPQATAELARAMARAAHGSSGLRRRAFTRALRIARRHLARWVEADRLEGEQRYAQFLAAAVAQARAVLAQAAPPGDLALGNLSLELEPADHAYEEPQSDLLTHGELPPPVIAGLRRVLDRIMPPAWTRRAIVVQASGYLQGLLQAGARAVEEDWERRVCRSRKRLVGAVYDVLQGAYEAVRVAVERARRLRAEGEAARDREAERLERLRREIESVANPDTNAPSGP